MIGLNEWKSFMKVNKMRINSKIMKVDMNFKRWWIRNTDPDERIGLHHWVEYRKSCEYLGVLQ